LPPPFSARFLERGDILQKRALESFKELAHAYAAAAPFSIAAEEELLRSLDSRLT
jgi:hypothetical protein